MLFAWETQPASWPLTPRELLALWRKFADYSGSAGCAGARQACATGPVTPTGRDIFGAFHRERGELRMVRPLRKIDFRSPVGLAVLAAAAVLAPAMGTPCGAQGLDPAAPRESTLAVERFPVRHRSATEVADRVRALLGPNLAGGVFVGPQANEIAVQGSAADRALAGQIVAKLDQAPQPVEPPKLEAYAVPAAKHAAAQQWADAFRGAPGERAAWDARTGQVILFAAPAAHADLQRALQSTQRGEQSPTPGSSLAMVSGGGVTVKLLNLTPVELHARLERLVSRPLPATWDASQRWLSFPAQLGTAEGVTMQVDAQTRTVTIGGDAVSAAAWRSVVAALDNAPGDTTQSTRLVPATPAQQPAIRKALGALRAKSGQPGKLVAMQVQGGQDSTAEEPAEQAAGQPSTAGEATTDGSLLGPVQVEFVEGLDIIVLRGSDKDVARVMEIINQIEELSAVTVPAITVHPLKHVGSTAMANLLNQVYVQVLGPRTGSVSITPLGTPNALLLIGRNENVRMAIDLATQLDQPVEPTARFEVFRLRHAVASDAKELIDQFLAEEEQGENDLQPAFPAKATVVADYRSNSLIVTASPRELKEIRSLVERIDVAQSAAVDEVRIFPLRNALAEDMAEVLRTAISQTGEDAAGDGVAAPKSTSLRFVTIDRETRRRLESGIVTGVRISPDQRANALVVSAPADSMDLIAALIEQLDSSPEAEAELKVFTIKNGDAVALEEMLSTLFNTDEEDPTAGGLGAASNSLVRLQFSVDERTNSIIAAGNAEDLAVVYAILTRLDGADTRERISRVFRLNNAYAVDVAETLTEWLDSQREAEDAAELAISPFEQIDREVIVVAEEASNSLIVSATPKYYEQLVDLVRQLDERPPMVMVQVLIAEVRLNDTDEFGMELGLQDSLLFDRSLVGELTTLTTTVQTQTPGGAVTNVTQQNVVNAPLTPGFNFNNVNQPLGNNGSTAALATAGQVAAQGLANFGVGRVNNALGFGGFVLSASSNSVDMLLRALQENRRLEVLSRPQITTLDGVRGRISVGQSVPRIENVSINQFGQQQNQISYEDVGIILEVQPRISPDGQVLMQIGAVKSEVGSEAEGIPLFAGEGGTVVRAPVIDQTVAETTVMAASGQTIVLSGLLTKSTFDIHRRVPILADIPLLGDFFRFDSVSEERTELLIILTPRVIRSEEDAEMIKQVESSRMSWVLCDVVTMHGPSGLRSRCDEWGAGECDACYPTHVPVEDELTPTPETMHPEMSAPQLMTPQWESDTLPPATEKKLETSVQTAGYSSYEPPRVKPTAGSRISRLPPVGR